MSNRATNKRAAGPNALTSVPPHLEVGRNVLYNGSICIKGSGRVKIGSHLAIGENLRIISSNHDCNLPAFQISLYHRMFGSYPSSLGPREIKIGSDVWFGDNVTVLPGAIIGDGCAIAAGSIVTKEIAPFTIAGGVPCKPIRQRFPQFVIDYLLVLRWWDWPDETIRKNKQFFFTDLSSVESIDQLDSMIVRP